jgi:hypothetical protein
VKVVSSDPLRTIIDIVQLSIWGEADPDITFEFESLWEMNDKDKADIRKSDAEADIGYVNAGIVSPEEVRERLESDEASAWHGVDLSAPPPELPEDGDSGAEDEQGLPFGRDGWNEGDHPRDKDGKFGSGGGGSGPGEVPGAMEVLQHITRVLQSNGHGAALKMGSASKANIDLVQQHTGHDLTGYSRTLEHSDIRHAMASHGNPAKEESRGQVAIKKADFALIPQIVEQAHSIELEGEPKTSKGQRIAYHAQIGGYEYHYVETIRPGPKTVGLKTLRKSAGR